jgi:hypothetical protein
VSHLRTHDEGPKKKETKERKPRTGGSGSNRMMDEVNSNIERSTFGDLSILSALKEQMEGGSEDEEATEAPAAEAPATEAPEAAVETAAEEPAVEAAAPAEEAATEDAAAEDAQTDDSEDTSEGEEKA